MARRRSGSSRSLVAALALAFTVGGSLGFLSHDALPGLVKTSILANLINPAVMERVASLETVKRFGEILAYHTTDSGELIEAQVGGDPSDASSVTNIIAPLATEPVAPPAIEIPDNLPTIDGSTDCSIPTVEQPLYGAIPVSTPNMHNGIPGESAEVTILMQNTGNIPWFSDQSGCKSRIPVQLGTMRERDHASALYTGTSESGWISLNRIALDTPRVDPGETGVFRFMAKFPRIEDVYREYFGLVIPGVQWVDASEVALNFVSGEPYSSDELAQRLNYLNDSSPGRVIHFDQPRSMDVSISEQTARLKIGEYVVRKFSVSTGSDQHPTPLRNWKVLFKQQWRIGAKAPYYIMPKFVALDRGNGFEGYGLHALPSLGNSNLRNRIGELGSDTPVPTEWFTQDGMWTEAYSHIGTRRSHGCVRFLPIDQEFVYDFIDIGTEIVTHN
ncbi:MAG: L,D-transpeptidase [Patescibacteria group bacterium]